MYPVMPKIQLDITDEILHMAEERIRTGRIESLNAYFQALVLADQLEQEALKTVWASPHLPRFLEQGINSGSSREWSAEYLAELKQQVLDRAKQKDC
jgi:hypothetical protein